MDMILEAAILLYMLCSVCIGYPNYSLKMSCKRRVNILMVTFFILMSSSEIVAQNQIYGIPYFPFCITLQWLSYNKLIGCETIRREQPHE